MKPRTKDTDLKDSLLRWATNAVKRSMRKSGGKSSKEGARNGSEGRNKNETRWKEFLAQGTKCCMR